MMVRDIISATAQVGGITVPLLLSYDRRADVSQLRSVGILASLRFTQRSLPALGRDWGGRDHTTIIHAERRALTLIAQGDPLTLDRLAQLLLLLDAAVLPDTRPQDRSHPDRLSFLSKQIRAHEAILATLKTELIHLQELAR